ncbi:uncharacterized protein [Amphiura filiformis]|uniref:uncharacterized protein n=1 Tax=Amphiura filiformis TaxID=82378 RepID=UPI003B21EC4D
MCNQRLSDIYCVHPVIKCEMSEAGHDGDECVGLDVAQASRTSHGFGADRPQNVRNSEEAVNTSMELMEDEVQQVDSLLGSGKEACKEDIGHLAECSGLMDMDIAGTIPGVPGPDVEMSGQSGWESGFASTSACDVADENTHGGATGILPIAAGVSAENFLSVTASSSLSDPQYRMSPCEPPSDISPLSGLPTEVSNEDSTARTMIDEPAHIAAALTDEHDSSQHGVSEQSLSMDENLPSADLDDGNLRINDSIEYLPNMMDVGTGSEQPPLIGHIDEALQNHPRAIGPPPDREQFYQYYQEEYIPSLSDDMMDFMDLRLRIEAGEETEEKQSVEVSLESRRQDYFHHLPRAYWIDVRRQNVVQTLLNLYEANPDWVKRRIHVRYLSDSIQPDDENNQQFWEEGIDENGLTKDLFANLCRCPIDRFKELVPCL